MKPCLYGALIGLFRGGREERSGGKLPCVCALYCVPPCTVYCVLCAVCCVLYTASYSITDTSPSPPSLPPFPSLLPPLPPPPSVLPPAVAAAIPPRAGGQRRQSHGDGFGTSKHHITPLYLYCRICAYMHPLYMYIHVYTPYLHL